MQNRSMLITNANVCTRVNMSFTSSKQATDQKKKKIYNTDYRPSDGKPNRFGVATEPISIAPDTVRHLGAVYYDFKVHDKQFGNGYLSETRTGTPLVTEEEKEFIISHPHDQGFFTLLSDNDQKNDPTDLLMCISIFARAICNCTFLMQFACPSFDEFRHAKYLRFAVIYSLNELFDVRLQSLVHYLQHHEEIGSPPADIRPRQNLTAALNMVQEVQAGETLVDRFYDYDAKMDVYTTVYDKGDDRAMVLLDDGLRRTGQSLNYFNRRNASWGSTEISALQYVYSATNEIYKFFELVNSLDLGDFQPDVEPTGFTDCHHDYNSLMDAEKKFRLYGHIIKRYKVTKSVYTMTNILSNFRRFKNKQLAKESESGDLEASAL